MRRVAVLLVAVLTTIVTVFIVGMRTRAPFVLGTVRRLNRSFFNPRQMATAGTPGAYAAVIRHIGRRSGREYETPIGAVGFNDGFVVALPYGTNVDWLRNVLAGGSAILAHEGRTYVVDEPEIIPIETVSTAFSASDQQFHRIFGVDQCLRLRRRDEVIT